MRRVDRANLWRFLAVALPALAGLAAALPAVDLAFGLRAGDEILRSGAVPTVDTWTFTAAGRPWIDQQWGAQVLLQLVFEVAGWTGLVVLRAALLAAAFGLLLAVVRLRAPRLGPISSTLLVIAAFAVAADALALRAQLFAIVLFAATLVVLAVRDRWPRAVWLIPVFALLWANLHGTFLFAPALCGLAWLGDLYDVAARAPSDRGVTRRGATRSGWRLHEMLVVGLVATVATLVNPYGPAVWGYVASLTSNPTIAARVSEWRPPSPLTIPGLLVWLSVAAVALLAARRIRDVVRAAEPPDGGARSATSIRRIGAFRAPYALPWPALLTLLLFGGFALTSGRGTAWWPFVAVFVIAPWLQPSSARLPRPTPAGLRRINAGIAIGFVAVAIVLLPVWRPVGAAGVPEGVLTFAPQGIANQLRHLDCMEPAANVWNPQVWGSWLEFATSCNRFSTDSRIELFTAQDWADVDAVERGGPGFDAILQRLGVEVVVTDHQTDGLLEAALRSTPRWGQLYSDADGSIWGQIASPGG
jgi:hypothetical protein